MKLHILFFFSLLSISSFGQESSEFSSPLDIPLRTAGTFGELRDNHFHAGIDLKTQGKIGLPVYATADGYVSRIRVGAWGYGKAIYLNHPNGYTTVYAHLDRFTPELEDYIKNLQYSRKEHEVQGFPEKDKYTFKKGDLIAYSGDTGGFVAPHLHYEIRDTKTEHILNPMRYGIDIKDTRAPLVYNIQALPSNSQSQINGLNQGITLNLWKSGTNELTTDTLHVYGEVSFQVQTVDKQNGSENRNGIYGLELYENDQLTYQHQMNEFSFSESKLINLLIDYQEFKANKRRYQKLYIPNNSSLSLYNRKLEITEEKSDFSVFKIQISDYKENKSIISIPVTYTSLSESFVYVRDSFPSVNIKRQEWYKFDNDFNFISIQKETFYEDVNLKIRQTKDSIYLDKDRYPLNKKVSLGFKISKDSTYQKGIALLDQNEMQFLDTEYKDGQLMISTKQLGTYVITKDTISPKIKANNFNNNQWITNYDFLSIKITDDQSGIKSFQGSINGNWIALSYNPKTDSILYNLKDIPLKSGKHILEIWIEDMVGNQTIKSYTLYKG